MSRIFPIIDVEIEKQGDGSFVVTVVHSQGIVTEVSFPYCAYVQDMAEDYAKHLEALRAIPEIETFLAALPTEPVKKIPPFTKSTVPVVVAPFAGVANVVPPASPTVPLVQQQIAPQTPPPVPTATMSGAKVIHVPIPKGDNNEEVEALEEQTESKE